jgi:DNA helicase HerA-like ATPase
MDDDGVSPAQAATAVSLDGRQFQFSGGGDAPFEPGSLVVLHGAGGRWLGQVEAVTLSLGSGSVGVGRVLGTLRDGESGQRGKALLHARSTVPFANAAMHPADADTVELLYAEPDVTLPIGTLLSEQTVAARLLAKRFNRHTFWCGQSGSGKTYALGVVLEQLLLHTRLPMVIFDPNADFVRIRDHQADPVDPDASATLADRDIRVLRPASATPLRARFVDMSPTAKAAVLHLHPLDDRAEYNELRHFEEAAGVVPPEDVVAGLIARGTPASRELAARVENLAITDWSVWAGKLPPVTEILDERPDATVLDIGGFAYPDESLVVALAVLDDLWAKREQRRPILIVIDEAHNLCSPDQHSPLHEAVRERLIQIAAEGRKFGLWLLLSTQRPSRIHASILSQCDNLALMKMTSPVDLDELGTVFGFVPEAMRARASRFAQGEALFAGGFVPAPSMVKMGARLTREGGADVTVPLRPLGERNPAKAPAAVSEG